MADRITTERILELWERSNPPPDEVRAAFRDLINARATIDALRAAAVGMVSAREHARAVQEAWTEIGGWVNRWAGAYDTLAKEGDWAVSETRSDLIATLTRCGLTDAEAVADGAE